MARTLAAALDDARGGGFVGRAAELASFDQVLAGDDPPGCCSCTMPTASASSSTSGWTPPAASSCPA